MAIRTQAPSSGSRLALGLLIAHATVAGACPAFLLGSHLPFAKPLTRDHVSLYAFNPPPTQWNNDKVWQPISLQVDPLDADGSLQFPKDRMWTNKPLDIHDRLSFSVTGFGSRYEAKPLVPPPCAASEIIELNYQGRYAYLMNCPQKGEALAPRPVSHDEKARLVKSNEYTYKYTENNHLLFDAITVAGKGGEAIPVAKNADLLIVGDVRNFFTLYFDSKDIDAEITHQRPGPLGLMGGMEFYLNILAFRINLELLPEVNFFEDSLFMPMSMTLPVDAAKYLRRGSGIYYSWAPEAGVTWDWEHSELDDLDLEHLDPSGKGGFSTPSPKHCNPRYCHYTIAGKAKDQPFVMNFKIARKAADLGFFPQLIRDVPLVEKTLDHKLGRYPAAGRIGIYFETARLPEGTHTWDFWIYFPDKNAPEQCTFAIKRQNVSQLLSPRKIP